MTGIFEVTKLVLTRLLASVSVPSFAVASSWLANIFLCTFLNSSISASCCFFLLSLLFMIFGTLGFFGGLVTALFSAEFVFFLFCKYIESLASD